MIRDAMLEDCAIELVDADTISTKSKRDYSILVT